MSNFTRGNWVILPPDDIENSFLIEAQSEDGIIESGTLICECYDEDNARLLVKAQDMHDTLCEIAYFLEQKSCYEKDEFAQYARMIRQTLEEVSHE
ncbi:MAG: hypothetical protein IJR35_06380 [Synergistaceae bacterium]|nr:hypothetical protein [Synergistaceae bacterium]MBQ9595473.1 hypothetical protein [Synergistaceae bacterium]